MSVATRQRRGSRLTREARREQLLEVAGQIVAEKGVDGLTMERLAERAGVSKGLGYAYFADSNDLLANLFDHEMDVLSARIRLASAGAPSFDLRLKASLEAFLDVVEERGAVLSVLFRAASPGGPLVDRRASAHEPMVAYWQNQIEAAYGISRQDAAVAADILMAAIEGAVTSWARNKVSRPNLDRVLMAMSMGALAGLAKVVGPPFDAHDVRIYP